MLNHLKPTLKLLRNRIFRCAAACPLGFRFLGRRSLRLSGTDCCLASEKRSSGKSRGWAWWVVCCYGDLSGVFALNPI
jgi:hypothetical protein